MSENNENVNSGMPAAESSPDEAASAFTPEQEAVETRFLIEQEEAQHAAQAAAPVIEAAKDAEPALEVQPQDQDVQKTAPMQAAPHVKPKKTTIGGQALIEGIMMCGPRRTSIAVRKADGSIYVEEIKKSTSETFFEKVPFVRGCIRFFRQLVTGTAAMMKSAEISEQGAPAEENEASELLNHETETIKTVSDAAEAVASDTIKEVKEVSDIDDIAATDDLNISAISEETTGKKNTAGDKKSAKGESKLDKWVNKHSDGVMVFAAVLGLAFSIMLFILLPRLIVDGILGLFAAERSDSVGLNVGLNFVEGFLRIIIFLLYLIFTSKIKDIARVWMYHGAEHKTIACYEAGEMLTVENVKKFSRFHPRCGTAFLFIVVLISILVFCVASVFIGVNVWWINLLIRLALVPLIGGISFEILRFTGRHDQNPVCKIFIAPGLWLQRFTTREPNDSMIEVAIAAMSAVIPENSKEDIW